MASHRYWRFSGFASYSGAGLALSELQLLNGTSRADTGASITSTIAPTVGVLASLQDGAATNVVEWVRADGLAVVFDCGASVEVNNFAFGSGGAREKFPLTVTLEWSDDGVAFTPMRRGDFYAWPGPFSMTRNVENPIWLRSGAAIVCVGNGTTLSVAAPPLLEPGDLLVTAIVWRDSLAPTVKPAGWVLLASAGPAGAANSYVELWGKTASDADKGATYSWGTNVTNLQTFALTGGLNAPILQNASGASDALNVPTKAMPAVAATGDRFAMAAANWTLAFTSGTTSYELITSDPWVLQGGPAEQRRMQVAVAPAKPGQTLSGTWSTQAAGSSGGWSVLNALFQSVVSIETTPTVARLSLLPARVLPLQPVPGYADFRNVRALNLARLRRDFANPMRGSGIGRINGTTKDKASPNIPVSERVVLFRQRDCMAVREGLSARGTGAFAFDYIDETETYFVVSFDHDGAFRAVIADNLTPDVMA